MRRRAWGGGSFSRSLYTTGFEGLFDARRVFLCGPFFEETQGLCSRLSGGLMVFTGFEGVFKAA